MTSELLFRTPQQERSLKTFNHILSVATKVIEKDGVSSLSMNGIAKLCKIPISGIYRYFPSRAALVSYLMQQKMKTWDDEIKKILERARTKNEYANAITEAVRYGYKVNRNEPFWREVWSAAISDRNMHHVHVIDNQRLVEIFFNTARRFVFSLTEEELMLKLIVLQELWDGVIRLAIFKKPSYGKILVDESIQITLRELQLLSSKNK